MSGWGWFVLVVILLVPLAYVGYIYYRRLQASKTGAPPPPWNPFQRTDPHSGSQIYPAPSGIIGWAKNKYHGLRNSRTTAGGGYEERRGGNGDDDGGAWDSRVENAGSGGYYEEQELGLAGGQGRGNYYEEDGGYTGVGGGPGFAAAPAGAGAGGKERGRQMDRGLAVEDTSYHGGTSRTRENPFGDAAEASSMRAVSPRPEGQGKGKLGHKAQKSEASSTLKTGDSPTERRSMFREGDV